MWTPDPETRLTILNTWRRNIAADRKFLRRPDPTIRRDLSHGWLLPYLLEADALLYGRWDYWAECMLSGRLPDAPIPPIEFVATEHRSNPAYKMLEACLNVIPKHGVWQTWGSWTYFDYLLDWLLYGFGHQGQPEPPLEPAGCERASDRLYQVFCLEAVLTWPYDYFGDILAENKHGRGLGFYPTPINVCHLMAGMLCGDDQDQRTKTVCDPCVGTGRMLLVASNWSLRLYGADINPTVIKACLVNGYLYAPWLVRPLPWLDGDYTDPTHSAAFSDSMIQAAEGNPAAATYLANTEHDSDQQWYFEPIKKRRRGAPDKLPPAADPSFAAKYRTLIKSDV